MASETRWLINVLLVFITCTTPARFIIIRTDESRSSTISTTQGHVLSGYVIHTQRTGNILSCAHLCLARPNCESFNYENIQNGICELNGKVSDGGIAVVKNALSAKRGYSFSQLVNISDPVFLDGGGQNEHNYVFTALGARGETGPSDTSGYVGTSLEGKVSLNNGIQIWTVPVTGSYVIEVSGGSGANGTDGVNASWRIGGLGAKLKGTFQLAQGIQLKILVGQEGDRTTNFIDRPGGGGGGSFVTLTNNTPLIIAGGGGGGGTSRDNFKDGDPGQATENGTRCGGTGGTGGEPCNSDTGNIDANLVAGGGAGLTGDGGGRLEYRDPSVSLKAEQEEYALYPMGASVAVDSPLCLVVGVAGIPVGEF
ncbi:Glycine rich protein [Desmophyllum pertusum]|uniref:Glycine rich protein n=1 Tax=Desmophyllum pertusum TaxID=174260 RepID=A0A9W9Z3V8_9CNID|nr:Glycine rich protein [Desmophyllum pertusum]